MTQRRPSVEIPCEQCGAMVLKQQWMLDKYEHHFCNDICRRAYDNQQIAISCDYCGATIYRTPRRIKKFKNQYCNSRCFGDSLLNPMVSIDCAQCGVTFDVAGYMLNECPSRGPQRYCGESCFHIARRDRVSLECETCGDAFEVKRSRAERGPVRFCSQQCFKDSFPANKFTCPTCGEDFAVTDSVAKRGPTFCSLKCQRASTTVLLICPTCGIEFSRPSHQSSTKFCSRDCVRQSRVSGIERIVAEELERRSIRFVGQARVGPYYPDFLIDDDTIIEVDGDYWHTLPETMERDLRKNAFYLENDFHLIRIWEHEIKAGDFSKLDSLSA